MGGRAAAGRVVVPPSLSHKGEDVKARLDEPGEEHQPTRRLKNNMVNVRGFSIPKYKYRFKIRKEIR